ASVKWLPDGSCYTTWEDSKDTPGGKDLVRHDPATGKQEVLMPAAHLIPPRESSPLRVDDHALSKDGAWLLIYTNSKRVWRRNTRGDYWVLDRGTRELRKLGGDAAPSSLMHAKLSPVGLRVAYVRNNNIYVESLTDGRITPLTHSKSVDEINGTFDWVYEEEFDLRDGFRWSPGGKSIAYWQLNTEGMREFPLVDTTDSLYPRITLVKYPKVGERNAACRVGIVPVDGGETLWLPSPGDPREHYIAYLEWTDPDHLILQQFDRLQDTALVKAIDIKALAQNNSSPTYTPAGGTRSGPGRPDAPRHDTSIALRTILEEHDDTWIDLQDQLRWNAPEREFLWLSERDGWRHIYKVSLS